MFMSKLKRQYLVCLAAAFCVKLPRILEIIGEPRVAQNLVVAAFVIANLAFLLFSVNFYIENARKKPMTLSLIISFTLWAPSLIKRYDGTLVFWLTGILLIALTTLVGYAAYVVITKALKFTRALLKRITRGSATSILALGMVSIFIFSSVPVAEANKRGAIETGRRILGAFGVAYVMDKAVDAFDEYVAEPLQSAMDSTIDARRS